MNTKRILTVMLMLIVITGNLIGKTKKELVLEYNPKANASKIVFLCNKYEKEFHLKEDTLLALIAVESSFRNITNGKSLGYVQMQMPTLLDMNTYYKVNKVTNKSQFMTSLENQIYYAGLHLQYLNTIIKSEKGSFLAYNVGLGAFKKGKYNIKYYNKIIKARNKFNRV